MTREKFIEELNFNCKVDGKEVWLNIMPCLEKLLDEHEEQLKAKNERIRELEELIKPKTCYGCKHKPNDGECYYEPCGTCARFFYDHYEPKATT